MESTTLYCPIIRTYAVAELDIEATVEGLDAEAQEAARALKPARCLVYLYDVRHSSMAEWLNHVELTVYL